MSNAANGDQLRQIIERIERMDAEIADLKDDRKEILAEAKGNGFDTKIILKVIALRKRDPQDVAEEAAILEMYQTALGL